MSICRVVSCVVGRRCLLWPVHSLGKTLISFCLASFCTPKSNLPVTPGISWLSTFAFQSTIMKGTSFLGVREGHLFWMLVIEGFVGLHRIVQLQLLHHYWLGHRFGLLSYWMACLGYVALTVWTTTNSGKFWKRWEYQTSWPASWEICMQVKKQQLELDMEQQTVFKQGKGYIKAVYCHPAYLTYMQSTSWERLAGGITSWNQDCQAKIMASGPITS